MNYVYDIECLSNFFSVCFIAEDESERHEFVIHKSRNDFKKLMIFLINCYNNKDTFIGFNNIGYDNHLINFLLYNFRQFVSKKLTAEEIAIALYNEGQRIINSNLYSNIYIRQIDLFLQKNYKNPAKRTSLKWLQYSTQYNNIQEMPIHHAKYIDDGEVPLILSYNWNDVESTLSFYKLNKYETSLREKISEDFDLDLLNASEPNLAKKIFAKYLCDDMKIDLDILKKLRTFRSSIPIKEILFDYIDYNEPILQDIHNKFKDLTVYKTKDAFKYEFVWDNVDITIAQGGIHGCNKPGVYKADDEYVILDIDVKSFYPNLAIKNNLRPAHLGASFNRVYENIYNDRINFSKKDPRNYVYKIILNSTYGLSNNEHSYFMDPKFTMAITINGQLLLLKLGEMLKSVQNMEIIQFNTDGVTIKFKKDDLKNVYDICYAWEQLTQLTLEYKEYDLMIVKDVNNYIAVDVDFKNTKDLKNNVKCKGKLEFRRSEIDFHKNPSKLVVPLAVFNFLMYNIPVRETIMKHNVMEDFHIGVKARDNESSFHLYKYNSNTRKIDKTKLQKVVRYYVCNNGGILMKHYDKGTKEQVEVGYTVNVINHTKTVGSDLNRLYYINEANKLIKAIVQPEQTTLF